MLKYTLFNIINIITGAGCGAAGRCPPSGSSLFRSVTNSFATWW